MSSSALPGRECSRARRLRRVCSPFTAATAPGAARITPRISSVGTSRPPRRPGAYYCRQLSSRPRVHGGGIVRKPAGSACNHMPSKKSAANVALGAAARAMRAERGLPQESLAALARIDRSYYGAIERGEFNVSLDTIVKIAAALEVPASSLLARARL